MLRKILSNSLLYFITTVLIKFAMLMISIMISRFSGKEVFGQFMTIRSTVSTIELISLIGMNQTSVKFIAENNHSNKLEITFISIILISFLSAICFSFGLFFFSENLSKIFFNANDQVFIDALKYSSFLLFFSTISIILTSILNGFENYKDLYLTNFYAVAIFILPTVYLIYNFHLIGAIIGVTIFFMLSTLFKAYKLKKHLKKLKINFIFKINKEKIVKLLKSTIPTFFSIILILPVFWYSKTLLISSSNGFNEIAMFEAAYQWLTIILVITGAVTNVSIPIFAKLFKNSLVNELKKALLFNLLLNVIISLMFCLIFINYTDILLSVYGKNYQNTELLTILLFSSIPFTAQAILNRFLISISKVWYNFFLSILWAIFFLTYIFSKINYIDSNILAEAFLFSYIFLFSLSFLVVLKQFMNGNIKTNA